MGLIRTRIRELWIMNYELRIMNYEWWIGKIQDRFRLMSTSNFKYFRHFKYFKPFKYYQSSWPTGTGQALKGRTHPHTYSPSNPPTFQPFNPLTFLPSNPLTFQPSKQSWTILNNFEQPNLKSSTLQPSNPLTLLSFIFFLHSTGKVYFWSQRKQVVKNRKSTHRICDFSGRNSGCWWYYLSFAKRRKSWVGWRVGFGKVIDSTYHHGVVARPGKQKKRFGDVWKCKPAQLVIKEVAAHSW